MTELQTATPPAEQSNLRHIVVPADQAQAGGSADAGVVVVLQTVDGVAVMKLLEPTGETQPIGITHAKTGQPLTWAELAVSSREAAVSGWYPGKLGGWVKLDWRDGGFAADAWTSDGAGMTAYDAAMRAASKRS